MKAMRKPNLRFVGSLVGLPGVVHVVSRSAMISDSDRITDLTTQTAGLKHGGCRHLALPKCKGWRLLPPMRRPASPCKASLSVLLDRLCVAQRSSCAYIDGYQETRP